MHEEDQIWVKVIKESDDMTAGSLRVWSSAEVFSASRRNEGARAIEDLDRVGHPLYTREEDDLIAEELGRLESSLVQEQEESGGCGGHGVHIYLERGDVVRILRKIHRENDDSDDDDEDDDNSNDTIYSYIDMVNARGQECKGWISCTRLTVERVLGRPVGINSLDQSHSQSVDGADSTSADSTRLPASRVTKIESRLIEPARASLKLHDGVNPKRELAESEERVDPDAPVEWYNLDELTHEDHPQYYFSMWQKSQQDKLQQNSTDTRSPSSTLGSCRRNDQVIMKQMDLEMIKRRWPHIENFSYSKEDPEAWE